MRFISTNGMSAAVGFSEAVQQGLAPDGGLYMPEEIPRLGDDFWSSVPDLSLRELAFEIVRPFMTDVFDDETIRSIINDAISFEAPLVHLYESIYILELFHGPTLAFKDFGARFMARVFARLESDTDRDLLILVATSGDTGSAVAHGFYGVPGTRICLLYPSGKVSTLQEKQMTTLGANVTALEVEGTFDDCQRLVKQAFNDPGLRDAIRISSANSINIARLIPQSFYYAGAWASLKKEDPDLENVTFSVPSGNFGNLTAGLLAERMGLPGCRFLAATNANNVVPEYLESGRYRPRASVRTLSNAMDVGDPSNFDRILHLFDGSVENVRKLVKGLSFDDSETRSSIRSMYDRTGYVLDPHTAVGVLAAEEEIRDTGRKDPVVVLSTAHPAKFGEVVGEVTGEPVTIPDRLMECMDREKKTTRVGSEYEPFKVFLKKNFN